MTAPARITHLIGSTSWDGPAGRTSPVFNPATGEVTGLLDLASKELVDEIVTKAGEAAAAWGSTSLAKRAQVLFAFRELLNADKERIARLITADATHGHGGG